MKGRCMELFILGCLAPIVLGVCVLAISSFFLVVFDDEYAHGRHAGWTYLIAAHIGAAAACAVRDHGQDWS